MLVYGLIFKRSGYSAAVRKFCFRLQFHSSGAYKELRKFFSNHLPTVRTMQRWLKVVDASPGITQIALDTITEKAKSYAEQGKQLLLTLVSDEMSIRKHIAYNEHKNSFEGFPTIVSSKQTGKKATSKGCLGIHGRWPKFSNNSGISFIVWTGCYRSSNSDKRSNPKH